MKGHPNIPSSELDTNIRILHAMMRPGERLSSRALAECLGCTNTLIYLIEKQALKKVREALRKKLAMDHGQFAQAKVSDHL